MALFDAVTLRNPAVYTWDGVPVVCAAVSLVLAKSDHAAILQLKESTLALGHVVAIHCRGYGIAVADPSWSAIASQERMMLGTLKWNVLIPNVKSWLNAFCIRFNALTKNLFDASMQWLTRPADTMCCVYVRCRPPSSPLMPRTAAAGILCICLMRARILHPAVFCPLQLASTPRGQRLLNIANPQGTRPMREPGHAFAWTPQILEYLQQATSFNDVAMGMAVWRMICVLEMVQ